MASGKSKWLITKQNKNGREKETKKKTGYIYNQKSEYRNENIKTIGTQQKVDQYLVGQTSQLKAIKTNFIDSIMTIDLLVVLFYNGFFHNFFLTCVGVVFFLFYSYMRIVMNASVHGLIKKNV